MPSPLEQLSLEQLRTRTSMKWRTHPADVLPLWVAEMDVQLAPPVADALRDAIDRGDTGYPYGTGYAEAVQEFAHDRWGWDGIDVARTAIVPDVMLGIVEVLRLVTPADGAVVINCPVYPPFYAFVEHMGRRVVEAPLGADRRIDMETLDEAFRSATADGGAAAYLLCNPHNPTGTVHSGKELSEVAALANRYGIRVVADEIHAPLILSGASFTPYLSVPGSDDAFSVVSASKGWNLAGLKAAVAIAGPAAAADLDRMPEEVGHGPSHLGVIAHTAAFREARQWLDDLLVGLDANRRLLGSLLRQHLPMLTYAPPEATYMSWLDCRSLDASRPDAPSGRRGVVSDLEGPAAMFLDKARVALSSGHVFGTGGAGHVRLNFATSQDILTEAVTRMGSAVG
ncbi:MalY/PatB family protein [Mycobacterium sp. URHB0044]|uniref:MalY/PatB family protein n=1 Tax=Mycobacterium sp. URHB0044 TaxID=1380386 RepID=UPI00048EBF16|nr:MalY/PatB family protein [Mycobacterium sp. URHB0044]